MMPVFSTERWRLPTKKKKKKKKKRAHWYDTKLASVGALGKEFGITFIAITPRSTVKWNRTTLRFSSMDQIDQFENLEVNWYTSNCTKDD